MSADVVSLEHRRLLQRNRHRIRRFAFRSGINRAAQQVLADLMCQLNAQQDGLIDCRCQYDRAAGEWVEHSVWRADRAPAGEDVPPADADALIQRLRASAWDKVVIDGD